MHNRVGYIYIRRHPAYDTYNACKLGKASNIPERDSQYATGEIQRGYFEPVFEIPIEKMGLVERILQYEFSEYNIKYNAGTEFYSTKIIDLVEPAIKKLAIEYRKLSAEQIDALVRCNRVRKIVTKIDIPALVQYLKSYNKGGESCGYNWKERPYQTEIIRHGINILKEKHKLYIELPTGGGKSYIVYNLLELLKSDFILIVSPRKIVNSQNVSPKYLQILSEHYATFNYSTGTDFDGFLNRPGKKLLICCTQSINKIYSKISSLTGVTIWFDESHWGIDEWTNQNIDASYQKRFWLLNNTNIQYRIFTSASPDTELVSRNEHVFGKLYTPVKIRELIDLQWLAPIKPYVYSENKKNVDNVTHILTDFNEQNKKYGFSFHNKQLNAFHLFYNHYLLYLEKNTHIKPFLLVSDDFTCNPLDESSPKEVTLDYNYRDIQTFENSECSMGYVVAKYSMGYDFNKLDFMCLSDPKLSVQDIKQCIGRGIRPDALGENGSNQEKQLVVSLPVYIDMETGDNKYEKIIEVLKYLLYDIAIPLDQIEFRDRYSSPNSKKKQDNTKEYLGTENVKSVLLNLLDLQNQKISSGTSYEKAKKIIAEYNLQNKEEYIQLCEKDSRLPKDPETSYKGTFIDWIDYLGITRTFYDMETCKRKVDEYLTLCNSKGTFCETKRPDMGFSDTKGLNSNSQINSLFNLSEVSQELCKMDHNFPPNGLWVQYYGTKDLSEIIQPKRKKYRR